MQTYAVSKTPKSITVGFKDLNLTLVAPLIEMLNSDKNVVTARFIDTHPELNDMEIFVEVSKGSPEDALKKALAKIIEYCEKVKV